MNNRLALLEFRRYHHPNRIHLEFHHYRDHKDLSHNSHRNARLNRRYHRYHHLNHTNQRCHRYRDLWYPSLQGKIHNSDPTQGRHGHLPSHKLPSDHYKTDW